MKYAILAIMVFTAMTASAECYKQDYDQGIMHLPHSGIVFGSINSNGYTYAMFEENGKKCWVAVMETTVNIGDIIEFPSSPPIMNIQNKSLGMTLSEIIFAPGLHVTAKAVGHEPFAGFTFDGEVVRDHRTGLMWARNGNIGSTPMTWADAKTWVKNLNYGGYSDWRLPTQDEIEPFSHHAGDDAAVLLNAKGFSHAQSSYYWSSTSFANNKIFVMFMGKGHGDFGKVRGCFVWPVRSER